MEEEDIYWKIDDSVIVIGKFIETALCSFGKTLVERKVLMMDG